MAFLVVCVTLAFIGYFYGIIAALVSLVALMYLNYWQASSGKLVLKLVILGLPLMAILYILWLLVSEVY